MRLVSDTATRLSVFLLQLDFVQLKVYTLYCSRDNDTSCHKAGHCWQNIIVPVTRLHVQLQELTGGGNVPYIQYMTAFREQHGTLCLDLQAFEL